MPPPTGSQPFVLLAKRDFVVEHVSGDISLKESPLGGGGDRPHRDRGLVEGRGPVAVD